MNLSTLTIHRPVLSIVLSTLIVLLGVVGYLFLGVRQFPNVDPPNISVTTTYPGANADVIESQITLVLEESINGIDGIRSLTSQSSDGRSTITVEFQLGEDLEAAANDVRDRVERSKRNLPPDVDPPVVAKADANSFIIVMTVQSDVRPLNALSDFAANVLKDRMQTIEGVGNIMIWGERKYAMRLVLDPSKLASYRLTTTDVRQSLQRENVDLPAGRLEGTSTELSVRTIGRMSSVEEFSNLILRSGAGSTVRVRDVARVYLGAENERTILKRDGVAMAGLAVTPQPGANQVDIADEFYRRYEALKQTAPKDITLDIAFDNTKFIRRAILEVEETLAIAFGLVVLIIFLFLRSWRATIIPVVAIPVSLISTFFFMWVCGFSINILTLLGIVLATGLVVDDAIVVMENIFRRIEEGESPMEAGEKGASEIYFAVISTTITLAVVFIPVIFLPGLTGRLFREFGVVVATSVLVSAFVSLTLTPMMSVKLLRHTEKQSWLMRVTEPFFVWMNSTYARTLSSLIKRPIIAVLAMVASIVLTIVIGSQLKSELAPLEDRSLLTINLTAPEGTGFNRMDVIIDTMQARVSRAVPEKALLLTVTSPSFQSNASNTGFGRLALVDPDQRTRTQTQIAQAIGKVMSTNTDVRTAIIPEQTVSTGGRAGQPVQFVIMASQLSELREVLPAFMDRAMKHSSLAMADVNLKFTKPELTVSIDRARARELGVSVLDIADAMQAGLAGQRYGFFVRAGKQYQVIGEFQRDLRNTPDRLRDLQVRSQDGSMISLGSLVTLKEQSTPPQLFRFNRSVAATVSAGLPPGKTIGDGVKAMQEIAAETLPSHYTTALTGPARDFSESSSSLVYAFLIALAFVYLILAAQFESFVDPFTIMFTVPLALAGGVLSLWIGGETLNIFSEIGAIVLIGLVTKNGILIVEFANQRREAGLSVVDAALDSASTRFRPILMTSLAMILGALPIALSLGAASGSRVGLGVVIVGGLLLATFLTLYVIPTVYVLMSKLKRKKTHTHESAATTPDPGTPGVSDSAISRAIIILVTIGALLFAPTSSAQEILSMDDAVGISIQRNYSIRTARLDSSSAALMQGSQYAPFLPTLNLNATGARGSNDLSQKTVSGVNTERTGVGFTNFNANATLSWTVFDGLSMFAERDRVNSQSRAEYERVRSRMSFTVADVISSYGAIVATRRSIERATTTLDIAERRFQILSRSRDAGAVAGTDVSQAEIDRNTIQAMLVRSRTDLATTSTSLNAMLGRQSRQPLAIDTAFVVPSLPLLDSLERAADARNPEVLAAERDIEVASASVRMADAAYMPRVALNGQYQYTNNNTDAGFILENRTNGWNVGFTGTWNLFNGFSDKYRSDVARVDLESKRLTLDDMRLQTRARLSQAYARYEQGITLQTLERASFIAAQRNAEVALEKLRLGTIRDIEVRQTQLTLFEIGERLARIEYETLVAATEAMRLSGALVR
ncbi:MAG: efflux RND transporter permease subunit [bacterium]|nr:efflux RND transporter permease subunit [bacterium]